MTPVSILPDFDRVPAVPELPVPEWPNPLALVGGIEFDLEAVASLEVRGDVAIASGERAAVFEHERSTVPGGLAQKPGEPDTADNTG